MSRSAKPNVRFWIYWNGCYSKITLRDGQTINLQDGGPTDEGWRTECHSYSYDAAARMVYSTIDVAGSDCDGPHGSYRDFECSVDDLQAREAESVAYSTDPLEVPTELPARPHWRKTSDRYYDQFAEAAGY